MLENERRLRRVLSKYEGVIAGPNDMTAGETPSALFWILATRLAYLLDENPERLVDERRVAWRRKFNKIIKILGVHFLTDPQVFENRNYLKTRTAIRSRQTRRLRCRLNPLYGPGIMRLKMIRWVNPCRKASCVYSVREYSAVL